MNQCPYCQSTARQVKAGTNRGGSQRYQCRECERHYTPQPNVNGYAADVRNQAVRLYLEGTNFCLTFIVNTPIRLCSLLKRLLARQSVALPRRSQPHLKASVYAVPTAQARYNLIKEHYVFQASQTLNK
jgi:hypothetical protein